MLHSILSLPKFILLTLVLVALKIGNASPINRWSWVAVLSPIWIMILIGFLLSISQYRLSQDDSEPVS